MVALGGGVTLAAGVIFLVFAIFVTPPFKEISRADWIARERRAPANIPDCRIDRPNSTRIGENRQIGKVGASRTCGKRLRGGSYHGPVTASGSWRRRWKAPNTFLPMLFTGKDLTVGSLSGPLTR